MSDQTATPPIRRALPRPSLRRPYVNDDGVEEIFIGLRRVLDDDGSVIEYPDRSTRAIMHRVGNPDEA